MIARSTSEKFKLKIKRIPLLAICGMILGRIIPGYIQYRGLVKKYGDNVAILRTAWHGTGDYYICGMYLREFLQMNRINNYGVV